jgi:hypothetical protein
MSAVLDHLVPSCHHPGMRWPAEMTNGTRWYRTTGASWARSAALLGSVVVIGLVLVLPGPRMLHHHVINDRPFGIWFLSAAGLVAIVLSVLQLRSGIGISADGVVLRTAYGRSQHAAWSQVDHFVVARDHKTGPAHRARPLVVVRSSKPMSTIGCDFGRSGKGRQQARKMVAAMESARDLRLAQPEAPAMPTAEPSAPVAAS